jgi:hypothetical protein
MLLKIDLSISHDRCMLRKLAVLGIKENSATSRNATSFDIVIFVFVALPLLVTVTERQRRRRCFIEGRW